MVFASIFHEITAILLVAAAVGVLGLGLRQPLIVSLLAAGLLVGPAALGLIASHAQIELLAHIGIALLLFVVGLKLDLHLIRTMGKVSLATGLGQVLFTSVFGFLIALGLGLAALEALYVAVALTFSSTIIIVKLLSDKREIDALHGRIAIGFLIVQDIVVVMVMIGLSALGGSGAAGWALLARLGQVLATGALFVAGIALMMRYVLPPLLQYLSRTQELLVLFAVTWAVFLASLGDLLGFSKEVGAFLGGVSLASTPYREALSTRLVSLRDFLLVFFFIDLGARLDLSLLGAQAGKAAVLSLFVLIGNPLIVLAIMGYMGYRKRTGFLAGLTVAQISEFSLLLGALGVSLGHVSRETMGLITLVGLVTIGASTYMILYSGPLYERLAPWLRPFERRVPFQEAAYAGPEEKTGAEIILVGLGNFGSGIARRLFPQHRLLGVDFDPEVLASWRHQGLAVFYGDVGDPDLLEHLPLGEARLVVSTVRDADLNLRLLHGLKARGYSGWVVLTARTEDEARIFQEAGAHLVLKPFADAAEQAADSLTAAAHVLGEIREWPGTLGIFRLEASSALCGRTIADLPLRRDLGVTIVAVSRAGLTFRDPDPDLRLAPGDRLVLLGEPQGLAQAAALLAGRGITPEPADEDHFRLAEIPLALDSPLAGKSLAEVHFRETYGVTVVALEREGQRLPAPSGKEILRPGDRLLVAGKATRVHHLEALAPL